MKKPFDSSVPSFKAKLVRNKIPTLMLLDGQQPKIRKAKEEERWDLLLDKLREETEELAEAHNVGTRAEELVDVLEVVAALVEEHGRLYDKQTSVEKHRGVKAMKKGTFSQFIVWEGNNDGV